MGAVGVERRHKRQGFRKVVGYITDFLRTQCNYRYLAVLMLFTGLCTYINFFVKSEDVWIKADPAPYSRLIKYLVGYTIVYAGAWVTMMLMEPRDKALRNWRLWALIFLGIILFSLRAWYFQHRTWVYAHVPFIYQTTGVKIGTNLVSFIWIALPCAIYWAIADRKRQPLYGFKAKGVILWPYFVLLLMMVPLLLWAAHQPDFQDTYPRAKRLYLSPSAPHRNLAVILYEIAYSLDFIVTEFFFRGFLILALARYAGPKVILPMCAFYVAIHFDKPLGEAISSFFGGLILGILAYRTGSIYGGIIVHLGIALLMELTGWLV